MDRAQLLAQIELALVLLDLDLGLSLDVLGDSRASDFAFDSAEQEFETLPDVEPLEDLVFVGDLEVEVGGSEVREAPGIGDIHLENRRHFVRNSFDQLGQRLGASDDP